MLVPIEKTITENIIFDSPMKLAQAVLYGVTTDGGTVELGRSPDPFELLETCEFPENHNIIGIAFQTSGWAAPLNPDTGDTDGRPSEHAERRRVVLVVTLTLNGFCSAMKFATQRRDFVLEETQFEESTPDGRIWDAMNECLDKVRQVKNGIETSSACSATLSKSSELVDHFGGKEGVRA